MPNWGLSLAAQGRYSGALRAYQDAVRRGREVGADLRTVGGTLIRRSATCRKISTRRGRPIAPLYSLRPAQAEVRYQLARVEARLGGGRGGAYADGGRCWMPRRTTWGSGAELAVLYREAGQRELARAVLVEGLAGRDGDGGESRLALRTGAAALGGRR